MENAGVERPLAPGLAARRSLNTFAQAKQVTRRREGPEGTASNFRVHRVFACHARPLRMGLTPEPEES